MAYTHCIANIPCLFSHEEVARASTIIYLLYFLLASVFLLAIMLHGLLEYGACTLTIVRNLLFIKTMLFPEEDELKESRKKLLKEVLK